MSEGEAKALVSKCDKDGSKGIDFAEFALLWEALHGEAEVSNKKSLLSLSVQSMKYALIMLLREV